MKLSDYPAYGSKKWAQMTKESDSRGVVCWIAGTEKVTALTDPFANNAPESGWDIDMYCHGCDNKNCWDCRPKTTA